MADYERAQLDAVNDVFTFIIGGRATFTLKSLETGKHFTYKVRLKKGAPDDGPFWVSVLNGPDNYDNYQFTGKLEVVSGQLVYTHYEHRSVLSEDAPSVKAFRWFLHHVNKSRIPESCQFWHEGKCCRCGRKLTRPESIAAGIGPVCANREAA